MWNSPAAEDFFNPNLIPGTLDPSILSSLAVKRGRQVLDSIHSPWSTLQRLVPFPRVCYGQA
jgi:hypothetical protein